MTYTDCSYKLSFDNPTIIIQNSTEIVDLSASTESNFSLAQNKSYQMGTIGDISITFDLSSNKTQLSITRFSFTASDHTKISFSSSDNTPITIKGSQEFIPGNHYDGIFTNDNHTLLIN